MTITLEHLKSSHPLLLLLPLLTTFSITTASLTTTPSSLFVLFRLLLLNIVFIIVLFSYKKHLMNEIVIDVNFTKCQGLLLKELHSKKTAPRETDYNLYGVTYFRGSAESISQSYMGRRGVSRQVEPLCRTTYSVIIISILLRTVLTRHK